MLRVLRVKPTNFFIFRPITGNFSQREVNILLFLLILIKSYKKSILKST